MNILIVGGGNMGATYAKSFLRAHIVDEKQMMILEKSPEKAAQLATQNIGTIYANPASCIPNADLIILAVKPQDTNLLFRTIRPVIESQQVILSIMAGVTVKEICEELGVNKVIRAMPNLPAQTGGGMTVFTSTDEVSRMELVMVQNLLNTTGKTIYTEKEDNINAATAVSGSGPAYVYYIMQAMLEATKEMGFNTSEAELLVSQTFRGAIELFSKYNFSFSEWIEKVASKGGTTEAALKQFEKEGLAKAMKVGMQAALARAIELGSEDK